jgi:hypothetical protein
MRGCLDCASYTKQPKPKVTQKLTCQQCCLESNAQGVGILLLCMPGLCLCLQRALAHCLKRKASLGACTIVLLQSDQPYLLRHPCKSEKPETKETQDLSTSCEDDHQWVLQKTKSRGNRWAGAVMTSRCVPAASKAQVSLVKKVGLSKS